MYYFKALVVGTWLEPDKSKFHSPHLSFMSQVALGPLPLCFFGFPSVNKDCLCWLSQGEQREVQKAVVN